MHNSTLFSIPKEIQSVIFKNCIPSIPFVISNEGLKACHTNTLGLLLICKSMKGTIDKDCQEHILKLKQICVLKKKYHDNNLEYLSIHTTPSQWNMWFPNPERMGNPQLLDAVSSKSPVIDDIKSIVTLTPQSLDCTMGAMRCRDQVPPLFKACCNDRIPIEIIEFLLESGANPFACLSLNNEMTPIFLDIETVEILDKQRKDAIYKVFAKYGITKDSIANDRHVVKKFLDQGASHLEIMSEELKNDFEIALLAVKNCWHKFPLISDELKVNPQFILTLLASFEYPCMKNDFIVSKIDPSIVDLHEIQDAIHRYREKKNPQITQRATTQPPKEVHPLPESSQTKCNVQ